MATDAVGVVRLVRLLVAKLRVVGRAELLVEVVERLVVLLAGLRVAHDIVRRDEAARRREPFE